MSLPRPGNRADCKAGPGFSWLYDRKQFDPMFNRQFGTALQVYLASYIGRYHEVGIIRQQGFQLPCGKLLAALGSQY